MSEEMESMVGDFRHDVLQKAAQAVNTDREKEYGKPWDNFGRIASLWNSYLGRPVFTPKQVAVMLALLKIARIGGGKAHPDNWVDLAGYAAIGGELEALEKRFATDEDDE